MQQVRYTASSCGTSVQRIIFLQSCSLSITIQHVAALLLLLLSLLLFAAGLWQENAHRDWLEH
jgi:hypothetical protein